MTVASLILVRPGLDWAASGGLFDFTLECLIPRLSDERAAESLRTVVDNNLGSVWLTEFPPATKQEIFELLRTGLVSEAQRALPESPGSASATRGSHVRPAGRVNRFKAGDVSMSEAA